MSERWNDPDDELNGPEYVTKKKCIVDGCDLRAGTAWSKYWCQKHNAERMSRLSGQLDKIAKALDGKEARNKDEV